MAFCEHKQCRRTLVVHSVPYTIRREDLTEFFSRFGPLSKIRNIRNTAEVRFLNLDDAENVLKLSEDEFKWGKVNLKPIPSQCRRIPKHKLNKNGKKELKYSINTLPEDVLSHIMSFLNFKDRIRAERVCKFWRHLGSNITWANVYSLIINDSHFSNLYKLNDLILEEILRRCGSALRKLDLSKCECQHLSLEFLIIIANNCPKLEEINLRRKQLSYESFESLVKNCQKLKNVDLSRSNAEDEWITELLTHCNIEKLNLSHIKQITGKNFHLLGDRIKEVNVNYCRDLSSEFMDLILRHKVEKLYLNNCKVLPKTSIELMFRSVGSTLKALDLGGYSLEEDSNMKIPDVVKGLSKCRNLEELKLGHSTLVDCSVVEAICSNCVKLKSLDFTYCYVNCANFPYLANLVDLRHLFFNYTRLTNDGLRILADMKLPLQTLELRACLQVCNRGCIAILRNLSELELLDISCCINVHDATTKEILTQNWLSKRTKKLKIFAGRTFVKKFVNLPMLEISWMSRCPVRHRPTTFIISSGYDIEANDDVDSDDSCVATDQADSDDDW